MHTGKCHSSNDDLVATLDHCQRRPVRGIIPLEQIQGADLARYKPEAAVGLGSIISTRVLVATSDVRTSQVFKSRDLSTSCFRPGRAFRRKLKVPSGRMPDRSEKGSHSPG